jgi:predicted nucleic acid-binding protein
MILLDSNVLSEFMTDHPDNRVINWLDRQPRTSVWTTSVSVFEIRFGLQTMPLGKRKDALTLVFERLLSHTIQGRIAGFDHAAAEQAAELGAIRQKRGRPGELRDTMIAGIVLASHATLATRNVRHFEDIAASVVNPWEP